MTSVGRDGKRSARLLGSVQQRWRCMIDSLYIGRSNERVEFGSGTGYCTEHRGNQARWLLAKTASLEAPLENSCREVTGIL